MALLEMTHVRAGYGKMEILRGVSLRIEAGTVVCIVGPNGAGKSTVLKTIFGLLRAREGEIVFDGRPVTNAPPSELLRLGMAFSPQGRNVFPLMTVEENLLLGGFLRKKSPEFHADVEAVYATFPVLRERRKTMAGLLSGGQQQMLEIGRALLLRPKLILLDEPTLGLSPQMFDEIFRIIESLRAQGRTIVLVEQNTKKALEVADFAYVLELGQNRYEGPAAQIASDPRVKEMYLGGSRQPSVPAA
jgi:branched-chain amino acid transport system ATP-binding protein